MSSDFLNAVLQLHKTKFKSTIVTAADKGYFVPVQALIASIKLNHEARLVVCDLGFTKTQKEWIQRQGALVFKPRLQVAKHIFFWQTWNKPFFIREVWSKFKNDPIVWIDADCIVVNSLKQLDRKAHTQFTIIADTAARNHSGFVHGTFEATNQEGLYTAYPTPERFYPGEQPNAGVIAMDFNRQLDREIYKQWIYMLRKTLNEKRLFNKQVRRRGGEGWISWHDQGCLQWAMEKCEATHLSVSEIRYNDPAVLSNTNSYEEFLRRFDRLEDEVIAHFPSGNKPYRFFPKNFNPDISKFPEQRTDLTIFVLGHKEKKEFDSTYLKYVHLPDIDENNDLAEARLFSSNLIGKCKSDFIGLATAQWNEKYKKRCWPLEKLHRLPMHVSRVWCGALSDEGWLEYSESVHPGITKYIEFLKNDLGVRNTRVEIPWSNNFIAHRSVVYDLQRWWWHAWGRIKSEFGNSYDYGMEGMDKSRIGSYLAERISMLYFCMRSDLECLQIPR